MMFHVTLEPAEDGWIVAECPALPCCVSQGRDEKEAPREHSRAPSPPGCGLRTRRQPGRPPSHLSSIVVAVLDAGHDLQSGSPIDTIKRGEIAKDR